MGPEIRFWYLVTTAGAHVQAFCGFEDQPQAPGSTQSRRNHAGQTDKFYLFIQEQLVSSQSYFDN
jgi:hypothetical protein